MNAPFQYGTLATKENFVDRVEDRAQLKSFLSSHINVMLISPRRWGKSSLVKVAMEELQNEAKDVRVCSEPSKTAFSSCHLQRRKETMLWVILTPSVRIRKYYVTRIS